MDPRPPPQPGPAANIAAPAAAAPNHRTRLPSLTGLRFFAALSVFFFHTGLFNSPIPPNGNVNPFADHDVAHAYEEMFSKSGYVGVSFFFVLSGFVLAWASRPGEPARTFLRRRVVKIFPNHLVIFALAMILFAGSIAAPSAWLPNIFLLQTWFPQASINLGVSPPSWTLGSELLFYMSFPLMIGPLRRIAAGRLWTWAGLMIAGMVVWQLITQFVIPSTPASAISPVSNTQFWFGYLFPPGRMFEFVLGILLARLVMAGKWPRIGALPLAGLMIVGYAAALVVPFEYGLVVASIIPVAAIIASMALSDVEGRRTGLRNKVMVWLGEVSFGFYLCQGITIFYLRTVIGPARFDTAVGILVIAGCFAVTLFCGWLLHSCVERPMMRRWSRRRTPARTPEPAVVAPVPGFREGIAVYTAAGERRSPVIEG
jgi:peptidoglycan/LPS O-acetylase OafA/YrhL